MKLLCKLTRENSESLECVGDGDVFGVKVAVNGVINQPVFQLG